MWKLDPSSNVWLNALVDGYGAMRVSFTDEDGKIWSGIAWKDAVWTKDKTLEQNESDKTTEIK